MRVHKSLLSFHSLVCTPRRPRRRGHYHPESSHPLSPRRYLAGRTTMANAETYCDCVLPYPCPVARTPTGYSALMSIPSHTYRRTPFVPCYHTVPHFATQLVSGTTQRRSTHAVRSRAGDCMHLRVLSASPLRSLRASLLLTDRGHWLTENGFGLTAEAYMYASGPLHGRVQ